MRTTRRIDQLAETKGMAAEVRRGWSQLLATTRSVKESFLEFAPELTN